MKLSLSLFLTVAVCQREKAGNEFSPFVDEGESCAVQCFCCVMTIFQYEQTPQYSNMLEGKEKGFLKYATLFSVETYFKMYEIFALWKVKGGGLESLCFTFFALLADSVFSLAVFAELMRVGTVLLQAIALSLSTLKRLAPLIFPSSLLEGHASFPGVPGDGQLFNRASLFQVQAVVLNIPISLACRFPTEKQCSGSQGCSSLEQYIDLLGVVLRTSG